MMPNPQAHPASAKGSVCTVRKTVSINTLTANEAPIKKVPNPIHFPYLGISSCATLLRLYQWTEEISPFMFMIPQPHQKNSYQSRHDPFWHSASTPFRHKHPSFVYQRKKGREPPCLNFLIEPALPSATNQNLPKWQVGALCTIPCSLLPNSLLEGGRSAILRPTPSSR